VGQRSFELKCGVCVKVGQRRVKVVSVRGVKVGQRRVKVVSGVVSGEVCVLRNSLDRCFNAVNCKVKSFTKMMATGRGVSLAEVVRRRVQTTFAILGFSSFLLLKVESRVKAR